MSQKSFLQVYRCFSGSNSMLFKFAPVLSFPLTCIMYTFVSALVVNRMIHRKNGENTNLVIIGSGVMGDAQRLVCVHLAFGQTNRCLQCWENGQRTHE